MPAWLAALGCLGGAYAVLRYDLQPWFGFTFSGPFFFLFGHLYARPAERLYALVRPAAWRRALAAAGITDFAAPADWTEEQIDQAYQEQKYGYSDIIGKSGLEYAMEDQLRGERGEKRITTDASGNVLTTEIIKQAKPGNTIVTTLDKDLQRSARMGAYSTTEKRSN